jgi:hypothetical protein
MSRSHELRLTRVGTGGGDNAGHQLIGNSEVRIAGLRAWACGHLPTGRNGPGAPDQLQSCFFRQHGMPGPVSGRLRPCIGWARTQGRRPKPENFAVISERPREPAVTPSWHAVTPSYSRSQAARSRAAWRRRPGSARRPRRPGSGARRGPAAWRRRGTPGPSWWRRRLSAAQ